MTILVFKYHSLYSFVVFHVCSSCVSIGVFESRESVNSSGSSLAHHGSGTSNPKRWDQEGIMEDSADPGSSEFGCCLWRFKHFSSLCVQKHFCRGYSLFRDK
ncbi:hypothetical protein PVL29_015831 [Vitis rotundifolia]|uniref:Uncharacterized protein n=1 Tax=Vitis rotundifolia TaxID=103349 RepID=A0AA39DJG9_VITRO|nr:hypothetical protein PVL29_015831 [Vitis rotundifolia]